MVARQTLLRMPIADSERVPKEAAGRGLTSMLRTRNFEAEETQRGERAKVL